MKIGIDLRALQTGHKYRGIGEVAKQVTNHLLELSSQDKNPDSFIFYEYDDDNPKKLLDIPKNIQYEVVKLGFMPEGDKSNRTKKQKIFDALEKLYGEPVADSGKSDVFLQFDYAFGVPRDTKTFLIFHDLIPYVFWDKFFESPMIPFKNKALRTTLRTIYANKSYLRILRRGLKSAYKIIAISKSTKNDLINYMNVNKDKITVIYEGTSVKPTKTGSTQESSSMPSKQFLLFIGAADERRRVDDLITAFNNLKADGKDLQLVLVGENFQSPENIPNKTVRNAVLKSSYKKDIITAGYVSDQYKQDLYKNALAFVYPTKYEGFGLPILESMIFKCPIITYDNSSTHEVGGDHALYAKDWTSIKWQVEALIGQTSKERNKLVSEAEKYAKEFTWDKMAKDVYTQLFLKPDQS